MHSRKFYSIRNQDLYVWFHACNSDVMRRMCMKLLFLFFLFIADALRSRAMVTYIESVWFVAGHRFDAMQELSKRAELYCCLGLLTEFKSVKIDRKDLRGYGYKWHSGRFWMLREMRFISLFRKHVEIIIFCRNTISLNISNRCCEVSIPSS